MVGIDTVVDAVVGVDVTEVDAVVGVDVTEVDTVVGVEVTDVDTVVGVDVTDVDAVVGVDVTEVDTVVGVEVTDVDTVVGTVDVLVTGSLWISWVRYILEPNRKYLRGETTADQFSSGWQTARILLFASLEAFDVITVVLFNGYWTEI